MPHRQSTVDHDLCDQEVLRANRELAAYFRGQRTEREARGALKIIKAFIRDRERVEPAKRRALPGVTTKAEAPQSPRKQRISRKPRRRPEKVQTAKSVEEPPVTTE